jgi:hypothetical protein
MCSALRRPKPMRWGVLSPSLSSGRYLLGIWRVLRTGTQLASSGPEWRRFPLSEKTDLRDIAAVIDRLAEQQRTRNLLALATLRHPRIKGPGQRRRP